MMKKVGVVLLMVLFLMGGLSSIISARQELFINQKPAVFDAYDMVIIAPEVFSDEIQPLIDHKNSINIQTFLMSPASIYDEYPGRDHQEKIKFFIKDAIETYGIKFVLLIGGVDEIPPRYSHVYFEYDYQTEWVFPSDLYYADIYFPDEVFSSWDTNNNSVFAEYNWSGNYDILDFYPDVMLGRLPCTSEEGVTTVVNKIINYDTMNAWTKPWFKNLVVIGGDSLPGDEYKVDEGEYVNQHVMDILTGFSPEKIWASNGKLYLAININIGMNPGAGFVFFNGHGHTDRWATHPHESMMWIPPGFYTNSHIDGLINSDKPAIVISDACYHCAYHMTDDCFAWRFVKHPSGGAIAFFGGTDIDVSYGGEAIITKGIERLCLLISNNYMNGDGCLGELWSHGLQSYMDHPLDEIDILTVEEFHLFGDPSQLIAPVSQPPHQPDRPSGKSRGKVGVEYWYTSAAIDPDDDSVYYLFDWGDGSNTGWLGPYESGDEINISKIYEERGSYKIRVKARDAFGMVSEWSEPLTISMPRSQYFLENVRILNLIFEWLAYLFRYNIT